MYLNEERARDLLEREGLDALVVTRPSTSTYVAGVGGGIPAGAQRLLLRLSAVQARPGRVRYRAQLRRAPGRKLGAA